MSAPAERPLLRGSGRVLMLGTVVLVAAAAAVLAAGAQDARLLRLGLVAALWAALLGAFAAARMRREIGSGAARAEELRTVYQLELEREVAARREHTLTVERELREQTEQADRREIAALRAELAAMRVNIEKLMSVDHLVERVALQAESARSRNAAGSSVRPPSGTGALLGSPGLRESLEEQFRADRSPVGTALPTTHWPVNRCSETALTGQEDPELRFGSGRCYPPELDTHVQSPVDPASSPDRLWKPAVPSTQLWEPALTCWDDVIALPQGNGRHNGSHGAPSRQSSGSYNNGSRNNGSHNNGSHNNGSHNNGSHNNGSHNNGSHNNGGGARRAAQETPAIGVQRSVNDLLAAHGAGSTPRRRRSREDGPQA